MSNPNFEVDKPRRALPGPGSTPSHRLGASHLQSLLRRALTVVVVSGIAAVGVVTFTASANYSTGTAFANNGPLGISASATSTSTPTPDIPAMAAARARTLAEAKAGTDEAVAQAAASARASVLTNNAKAITTESDRLKNLSKFMWPTDGSVGSGYGMRFHPILHYWRMHDGDDIGGACGQPIWAAQSGVVVKAEMGYNGGSGNNVRIDHGDINGVDVQTGYLHMSRYVVSVGQHVNQGDVVGYVGDTGLSTACHLHFSAYKNGSGTDPMEFIGWNKEAKKAGDNQVKDAANN